MASSTIYAAAIGLVMAPVVLSLPAPRGPEVAAIFPPWWPQARAIAAAADAGPVVQAGGARFVVVVRAPTSAARARLRRDGALALIDPAGLRLCGQKRTSDV